jgi:hypothetical protein
MTHFFETMANVLCCRDVGISRNFQVCAAMGTDTVELTFWRDISCVDSIA